MCFVKSDYSNSFFKDGPFPACFSLFSSFLYFLYNWLTKFRRWWDPNRGSVVLEVTGLPTEPHHFPDYSISQ